MTFEDAAPKGKFMFAAVLAVLSFALLSGCQDPAMRDKVKDGRPVIMVDPAGNLYVVEHHIGNTYLVLPLKSEDGSK